MRWASRLMATLTVGLVLTVAVSWVCAIGFRAGDWGWVGRRVGAVFGSSQTGAVKYLYNTAGPHDLNQPVPRSGSGAAGADFSRIKDIETAPWDFTSTRWEFSERGEGGRIAAWGLATGWPWATMRVEWVSYRDGKRYPGSGAGTRQVLGGGLAVPWIPYSQLPMGPGRLPLMPMWPGFGLAVVMWAAVAWGSWAGVSSGWGAARGWWRRRGGRCAGCGYEVRALAVCPECGRENRAAKLAAWRADAAGTGKQAG